VFDVEQNDTYTRLGMEWSRVLVEGVSTWVRGGRAFGSDAVLPCQGRR